MILVNSFLISYHFKDHGNREFPARVLMDALKQDALFHTLIETAVDGIVLIDSKATVKAFNGACEALFGYAASEVIGRNVKMLMPEPYRESHDGYVEHYQKTGEKRIIGIGREVVGKRKDGNTFPMYLSVGEGVLDGERIYVGIIHDLTVRDETARRMRVMQAELLHVSRLSAMGQMTAALAHELNQPLTAIMNYMTAARRLVSSGDPAQSARGIELIEKAVQQTSRAGQIIKRLREFVEKRETARTEQNLNEAVEEAIALAFAGSSDAGVKVKLTLDPGLPPVLIDRIQVQQVLLNLIRNGIEAMQGVPIREMTISTVHEDAGVEFSISDTGPGLAPEVALRLFQPFVTTKENGMGIGLSICQSIVEAHNGRIWAEPNDSSGVTFKFRLPLANAG